MAGATLTECFLVTDKFAVSATELLLGIFITGCYCTALYMLYMYKYVYHCNALCQIVQIPEQHQTVHPRAHSDSTKSPLAEP